MPSVIAHLTATGLSFNQFRLHPHACLSTLPYSRHLTISELMASPTCYTPHWVSPLDKSVGSRLFLKEHEPNLLLKRYLLYRLMGALSKYQLALTPCICCYDDALAPLEESLNDLELLCCCLIVGISFVGFGLADLQLKFLWQNW